MSRILLRPVRSLVASFAVASVLILALLPGLAGAHETRTVANDYEFVVGFIEEPAIQNDTNGLSLTITKAGQPVLNAQDTLRAQVVFGDQGRDLVLTPVFDTQGEYRATFIPTQPGDYTFRITGDLEGTAIDETFTSSPEGFDSVAPRTDYEFPGVPANGERNDDVTTVAIPVGVAVVVLIGLGVAMIRRQQRTALD